MLGGSGWRGGGGGGISGWVPIPAEILHRRTYYMYMWYTLLGSRIHVHAGTMVPLLKTT